MMLRMEQRNWVSPLVCVDSRQVSASPGRGKAQTNPFQKNGQKVSSPVPCINTALAPLVISCIIGELEVLVPTKTSRDAAPDKFGQIDNADL